MNVDEKRGFLFCFQTGKRKSISENSSDRSDDEILRRRKKRKGKRTKSVRNVRLTNDKEDGELSSQSDESVIVVPDCVTEMHYEG